MAKLWISKYALTDGAIKSGDWDGQVGEYGYVNVRGFSMGLKLYKDAHKTPDEAIGAAYEAREKKRQSLLKQVAKLEALTFSAAGKEPDHG